MKENLGIEEKKVIIITEYAFEDQNSTGYYWSKIINKTCSDHKNTTVICRKPNNIEKSNSDANYKYIPIQPYELKGITKRIFSQIKIAFNTAEKTYRSTKKGDIVFTGTNPIIFTCLVPILKKIIRFKWILIVHDLFPNYLKPYKIINNNFAYAILENLSNLIYKNADHIIVIGRDMQSVLDKRKINIKYMTVIQNWANTDEIHTQEKDQNPIIKKLKWENFIVFGFFGNIGNLQGINNILETVKLVTHKEAAFLFIGTGNLTSNVQDFINTHPDINIKYYG